MDIREKYEAYVNTAFMAAVEPVVVDRAQGATYYDGEGREFIDCFSGISVANTGHGNADVVNAARAQMEKLIHCCSYVYHVQPVADLAEKMAAITPGRLKKSFFGSSGAEAIEGAMRMAKRFTGRNEALALTQSFHGRTYATLSVTGNAGRKKGGGPYMPGVAFAPSPYCYRCPLNMGDPETCGMACAEQIADVIKTQTSENVAYLIAEPILGEGGIIVPPDKYFQTVKQVLDQYGILFMADEVQTGFCRTGRMFAVEHYGIEPDIMVMAKGIANGFPLSCFIARQEIADAFQPGDHLSTFGGNPVSCAASLANIEFMEKTDLAEDALKKGEILKDMLGKISPKAVAIGEIRGKGLMVGVEIVEDKDTKVPAPAEAAKIRAAMREKGALIGVGGAFANVLRIQPPLVISEVEMERVVETLKGIMEG